MVIHHERAEAVPLRRGEGDEDVHGDRGAVAVLELELDEARDLLALAAWMAVSSTQLVETSVEESWRYRGRQASAIEVPRQATRERASTPLVARRPA